MSKDIVFFIDNLNSGGAQKQISLLCNLFARHRRSKCYLVHYGGETSFWDSNLTHENIKIFRLNGSNIFRRVIEFNALMRVLNVNKIIVFLFIPSIIVSLASILALFRWEIIYSERSFEANTRPIFNLVPRQFYRFSKAVTVNSNSQFEVLSNKALGLGDKLKFVPNGLIVEEEAFILPQSLEILAIGRVSYDKGTDNLIEVLRALRGSGLSSVHVKWVGSKEDSKFYRECELLLEEYHLSEFWTWIDPTSTLDGYYKNSSLLVHLSRGEGFPNVVCEALGKGLNVVLFDVNDHSRFLGENCGYLADLDNISMVVDAVLEYNSLPYETKLTRKYSAVQYAKTAFSAELYFRSYNDLIG
ncbi:glycosyltransferase [Akkermansiaceae bacterium]|nr:glycosyltransferase [Akkermansiaceae bacterium]